MSFRIKISIISEVYTKETLLPLKKFEMFGFDDPPPPPPTPYSHYETPH